MLSLMKIEVALVSCLISPLWTSLIRTALFAGMYMADASVFMSCVSTLAAFDISKVLENGVEVEPSIEYTTGTVRWVAYRFRGHLFSRLNCIKQSHPKPFKCSIKPRSSQADNLIRTADERAWDQCFGWMYMWRSLDTHIFRYICDLNSCNKYII